MSKIYIDASLHGRKIISAEQNHSPLSEEIVSAIQNSFRKAFRSASWVEKTTYTDKDGVEQQRKAQLFVNDQGQFEESKTYGTYVYNTKIDGLGEIRYLEWYKISSDEMAIELTLKKAETANPGVTPMPQIKPASTPSAVVPQSQVASAPAPVSSTGEAQVTTLPAGAP